ncbi:hypothetical protein NL676_039656 [Syzygium grande]|nr:hypothetical protein NL676_039656 [Syzygium grande]
MEEGVNGTVTSLASMFPADKAQKAAAARLQYAIARSARSSTALGFRHRQCRPRRSRPEAPEELHHDVMACSPIAPNPPPPRAFSLASSG